MFEPSSEWAMDLSLFSLSKGPSLTDYTVPPALAWDVHLEFSLAEWHDFPRKDDKCCFCLPVAYGLVVRALLAGEKCQLQSHSNEKGKEFGSPFSLLIKFWISLVFFSVQTDPSFTSR